MLPVLVLAITSSSIFGVSWIVQQERNRYKEYYKIIEKLDEQIENAQRNADAYRNQYNKDDLRYRVDVLRERRKELVEQLDEITPFNFQPF